MQDLAQLNRLCAYDYPIEKIRLDNTGDSTYHQNFHDYYMSIGMDIEHLIAHVHIQKWPCEIIIYENKHAILHVALLVRIKPTNYYKSSPLKLVLGQEPNISHIRIYGCAIYVSIAPPQRTKMGTQRMLEIYVEFSK